MPIYGHDAALQPIVAFCGCEAAGAVVQGTKLQEDCSKFATRYSDVSKHISNVARDIGHQAPDTACAQAVEGTLPLAVAVWVGKMLEGAAAWRMPKVVKLSCVYCRENVQAIAQSGGRHGVFCSRGLEGEAAASGECGADPLPAFLAGLCATGASSGLLSCSMIFLIFLRVFIHLRHMQRSIQSIH